MTSKPVRGITITKDGKVKSKPPRMAGHERKRIEGKAKSLEKRWRAKSK
jgi:ribosomal protein S30